MSWAERFVKRGAEATKEVFEQRRGLGEFGDYFFMQDWPFEQAQAKATDFANLCRHYNKQVVFFSREENVIPMISRYPQILNRWPRETLRRLGFYPRAVMRLERDHRIKCWDLAYAIAKQYCRPSELRRWHVMPEDDVFDLTWYIFNMTRFTEAIMASDEDICRANLELLNAQRQLLSPAHIQAIEAAKKRDDFMP